MEEKLQLIESGLYKSEVTFPPLRERLLNSGELKAWYRYYRGGNRWAEKHFMEESIFLMSQLLIWNRISEEGNVSIYTFRLDDIHTIDRSYVFKDKTSQELILSEATITFRTMKNQKLHETLVFKRPLPGELGDVEGFNNLISLLE